MLGPPAGPAFPKELASWEAARKNDKVLEAAAPSTEPQALLLPDVAIGNYKVLRDITTLPPAPCRFLQGGGARTGKMTKCWARRPAGSVVVYILNGNECNQESSVSLLEKPHQ